MTVPSQKAALAQVQRLIAAGNDRIAKLDPGLTAEARRQYAQDIRDDVLKQISATRDDMGKRRQVARDALPRYSQEAIRRKAKFAEDPALDAQLRMGTFETLKRTATPQLIAHLKDAIEEKSVARAEAIRLEFQSRDDRNDYSLQFSALFGAVIDPEAKAMEADLTQIDGLAAHAETLIHEFARGVSDPAQRLATARMAGLDKAAA